MTENRLESYIELLTHSEMGEWWYEHTSLELSNMLSSFADEDWQMLIEQLAEMPAVQQEMVLYTVVDADPGWAANAAWSMLDAKEPIVRSQALSALNELLESGQVAGISDDKRERLLKIAPKGAIEEKLYDRICTTIRGN